MRVALAGLKTAYALVNPAGYIVGHDQSFSSWISEEQSDLVGQALLDVLPEFVGQEDILESVRQGKEPLLRLENINRETATGSTRYLTLTVISSQSNADTALIVLVADVTQQGNYLQQLMQSRNELYLVRRKLAQLNDQLDYLLRHYVPQQVANALLQGELRPELGGELCQVSILFADVRDFTPLAEKLSPEQVVQILNDYLNVVADAINEAGGIISQFQGDNVMAIFNVPISQPDHARQAVQAGIALQQAVAAYRVQRPPEESRLDFGVGISTGSALVGNVGAHWRYTYTAIGDTVNLAARITGAVPPGEIWLSQETYEQLDGAIAVEPLPTMTFKGKKQSINIYRALA